MLVVFKGVKRKQLLIFLQILECFSILDMINFCVDFIVSICTLGSQIVAPYNQIFENFISLPLPCLELSLKSNFQEIKL